MGDHHVGEMFKVGIESVLLFKEIDGMTNKEALAVFDKIGNECLDTDAEFDDLFTPDSNAYRMLCKAFYPEILKRFPKTPNEKLQPEEFSEWDKMFSECYYKRFKKRYGMC